MQTVGSCNNSLYLLQPVLGKSSWLQTTQLLTSLVTKFVVLHSPSFCFQLWSCTGYLTAIQPQWCLPKSSNYSERMMWIHQTSALRKLKQPHTIIGGKKFVLSLDMMSRLGWNMLERGEWEKGPMWKECCSHSSVPHQSIARTSPNVRYQAAYINHTVRVQLTSLHGASAPWLAGYCLPEP